MISRWVVETMQEADKVMEAVEGFGTVSDTLDASLAKARKGLTNALATEGIHGMTHEHRWLDRAGVNVCWCGATDPPYRAVGAQAVSAKGRSAAFRPRFARWRAWCALLVFQATLYYSGIQPTGWRWWLIVGGCGVVVAGERFEAKHGR